MKTFISIALLVTLPTVAICADEKAHLWDFGFNLKPSLLNATDSDDFAGAIRWRGKFNYDYAPWRGNITGFAAANTRGTLATDAQAHSESISFDVNSGLAWQLQKPDQLGSAPPPDERDPNAPATTPPSRGGFRWGRVELSGKVAFETDQKFNNYAITFGPQLGYFHNNEKGLWPLVPSLYMDYQRVELLESDYYQSLALDDSDSFFRFSTIASWQMPIGIWLARDKKHVRPLGAVFNLQYSLSHDVPTAVKAQGRDESFYFEAGLNYDLAGLQPKWIQSVYITVANGRIAPATDNKTMVFLGIVVDWPKKSKW